MSPCPNCGCPFTTRARASTADLPRTIKDPDGTWRKGHARESQTERCDGCGRTVLREWSFGKLVREEVTDRGRVKAMSLDDDPTSTSPEEPSSAPEA